jgi:plastocyanin
MLFASLASLSFISVASAAVHEVTVGGAAPNTLLFQPEALYAEPGDTVRFTFKQKNHTVTQTSFGKVCEPLLDQYTQQPALDSGFQPVGADQTADFPTWDYTVKDTTPVWLYCKQAGHCGKGMVFSVNCPATGENSFENYKKAALAYGAAHEAPSQSSSAPPYGQSQTQQWDAPHSSWAATATSDVYGGQTYAPVYHPTVTETVTLGTDVWTTAYESYPNSPAPTPVSPQGTEHRVIVGGNGTLTYDPPSIAAAPRDTIVFEFRTKNHTVTQSSFGRPCQKLDLTSTTGQKGFDSGFVPADASLTSNFPSYTVTVNDTAPIWVYCRQQGHCGQGMVFAVNADESSDRNYGAFAALAKTINGTSSNSNNNSTGETSSDDSKGTAPAVRASMVSAALLAVGGLFAFAL